MAELTCWIRDPAVIEHSGDTPRADPMEYDPVWDRGRLALELFSTVKGKDDE